MQYTLFDQMHKIWNADLHDDMGVYAALFIALIDIKGYRFKDEVEGDDAGWHVEKYGGVQEAFIEHINSVKSYNDRAHFATICALYLEKQDAAQMLPTLAGTHFTPQIAA